MSDLIRKQDAIDILVGLKEGWIRDIAEGLSEILMIPSAESERKKGKWISHENYNECSKCHCFTSVGFNYCPHCGADMRGENGKA